MTSLADRISTLEQKYQDEANAYVVDCIISRLTDGELLLMECAAKYREKGHTEEDVGKYLTELGKLEQYQKAVEHFEHIHAELDEASARGEKVKPLRW